MDKIKTGLVIGGSSSTWEEAAQAQALGTFDRIYCVKRVGITWSGSDFIWVTLHPEYMDDYEAQRKALGLHKRYEIVAPLKNELADHSEKGRISRRVSYRWPNFVKVRFGGSASSGIYGAKIALEDGCERIVLAGVPMEESAGHITRKVPWAHCASFLKGFEFSLPHLRGKVRSMSGLTREKLGFPTSDWLAGI